MSRRASGVNVSQEPGPSTSRTSQTEFEFVHFTEPEAYPDPEHILDSDDEETGNTPDEGTSFNLSSFKPAGTRNSRDYYPLRHHQLMFDAWEAAHRTFSQFQINSLLSIWFTKSNVANGPAPGAGGNLADLQDGNRNRKGGRPPHGLRFIIECAIYGSPEKRLTLREIEIAIVRRFAWFADPKNKGWQVRKIWLNFLYISRTDWNVIFHKNGVELLEQCSARIITAAELSTNQTTNKGQRSGE